MMQSLAPGGRCAVVVPEGLLFGSTKAHKDLRQMLRRSGVPEGKMEDLIKNQEEV